MITLPAGFSASTLFADFFAIALPFVSISSLIAAGFLISGILKRVSNEV